MIFVLNELSYFFAALRFFTRLPVPRWVGHAPDQLDRSARYFPLVGLIVGAIGAGITESAALVLPVSLSILLGMAATLLATGAFHEDGLADAADGFGGGRDRQHILAIMKDSRIGSYGAVAVGMVLLAKYTALTEIDAAADPPVLDFALLAGHAVSRLAATTLMRVLDYARIEDETAKSKPLARRLSGGELLVAGVFGLAPCVLLPGEQIAIGLGLVTLVTLAGGLYLRRRLGGYTGDCLGAVQQLAELAFYFGLLCEFA